MSIPIEKNEEMTPEVRRSPSEIQARIKELREEMGREGREHAVKNFNYNVIAKKMLDIRKEKLELE